MQFSLPNNYLHFKSNAKRLKFKYKSFSGCDFLKTVFMVHYRFLGSLFELFEDTGNLALTVFFCKTAVALFKFYQIT